MTESARTVARLFLLLSLWLAVGRPSADARPSDAPSSPAAPADPTYRYVDGSVPSSGDGRSWATAWKTISEAAEASLAPGTVVRIRPGTYRETVTPANGGTAAEPIIYRAEDGLHTVHIVGSETSETLGESWQPLSAYTGTLPLQPGVSTADIRFIDAAWTWEMAWDPGYGTVFPIESDLVAWVQESGGQRQVTRLTPAREPDWTVDDVDRWHENWWAADGGAAGLGASSPSDSNVYLMDTTVDNARDEDGDGLPDFPNIPASHVQATFTADDDFGDPRADRYPGDAIRQAPLAASVLFNDGRTGHYSKRLLIDSYDASSGILHVINPLPNEGPDGEGHMITERTKFTVEGAPRALDCPGEWVHYDGRLFVLTGDAATAGCGISLASEDLPALEIARRFSLLHIEEVSHLRFEELDLAFNNYARYGYQYRGWGAGDEYPPYLNYPLGAIHVVAENNAVEDIVFDTLTLEHAVTGLYMGYPDVRSNVELRDSVFHHIDGTAVQLQAPDDGHLEGIIIEGCQFEDLGFRPQIGEGVGLSLSRVSDLVFRDNTVTHVAHNGVQFHPGWGSYVSHDILVEGNTFDGACRMAYDCGGLKFHGGGKGYVDVLVKGNVSRNHRAWSYAAWVMELPYRQSEPGGWWPHSPLGELGMGIYLDYASGVTIYRNLLLDSSAAGVYYTGNYREHQPNVVLHNTIFGTLDGVHFGDSYNGMPHTDSRIQGNILAKVENAGVHLAHSDGDSYDGGSGDLSAQNVTLDHNVYKLYATAPVSDPWPGYDPAWFDPADLEYLTSGNHWVTYTDVAYLQAHTPWEDNGVDWQAGQPLFVAEGAGDAAGYRLAETSVAIDVGTTTLPAPLTQLMADLQTSLGVTITDAARQGAAYDAGAFEFRPLTTTVYLPLLVHEVDLLNQDCAGGEPTTFAECSDGFCCETNGFCGSDADCQQATTCFFDNGGMRSYDGISACIDLAGTDAYMANFACRFIHCGGFMTLNEGEHCLRDRCRQETVDCFSNPACFAQNFCIVDGIGTPAECAALYPDGNVDLSAWQTCGQTEGCFDLMP